MGSTSQDKVVISVGGSLIVPDGSIDIEFLKNLNAFIRDQLAKHPNRQFFWSQEGEQQLETIGMQENRL